MIHATLVDNAGVIQIFGARNRRMAQDFVTLVGNVDADTILNMPADERMLRLRASRPGASRSDTTQRSSEGGVRLGLTFGTNQRAFTAAGCDRPDDDDRLRAVP